MQKSTCFLIFIFMAFILKIIKNQFKKKKSLAGLWSQLKKRLTPILILTSEMLKNLMLTPVYAGTLSNATQNLYVFKIRDPTFFNIQYEY